jgi:hypothetical protein
MSVKINFLEFTENAQRLAQGKVEFSKPQGGRGKQNFTRKEVEDIVKRVYYDGYIRALNDVKDKDIISF